MVKMYTIIAKVSDNKFIKYHRVVNLKKLRNYLTKTWPDFRFCNYYDPVTRKKIGYFTKYSEL